ncbi:MAG: phosphate acyltransferase PlsX [Rhodospirillaceae bacterium]|nr:phosphate acyltransferase PlsX [Rhodospirillaceae bacterium]
MSAAFTLSLDAMGGDYAPEIVLKGAAIARVRYPTAHFLLFGDEARLKPLLDADTALAAACTVRHTEQVISGEMKPSQAIRQGRQSSMWKSIEAVKNGEAAGVVSAGNTGALMAMAKIIMRPLPGIDRPAICSLFPTRLGETVMLDLGANAECDAQNLVQFAIMGECFARAILGLERPSVGLLNIGSEDVKGTGALREASQILRSTHLDLEFKGFIEGDDIAMGTVDVVVTDGFTGNVALKTAEGTAKLFGEFLKVAIRSSWLAKFGMLFAKPVLSQVMARTDARRYNGALFVGLNGVVVKSHGGTDAVGFANAIGVAVDMIARDLNRQIGEELAHMAAEQAQMQQTPPEPALAAEAASQ